jgi:helix-turn-helix, Psq domain.
MIDWLAIKNEYISTGISQRKLAKKYDVSFYTLQDRARKEHWFDDKTIQHDKIMTETLRKTAEWIADTEAERIAKLTELTDIALKKLEKALENKKNGVYEIRCIVQSLKGIKDIIGTDKPQNVIINESPFKDLTTEELKALIGDD